jgi:hypothetical protein
MGFVPRGTKIANDIARTTTRRRKWPATANALSAQMRRAAPNLRRMGIDISFDRAGGGKRNRTITLSCSLRAEDVDKSSSSSSLSSRADPRANGLDPGDP